MAGTRVKVRAERPSPHAPRRAAIPARLPSWRGAFRKRIGGNARPACRADPRDSSSPNDRRKPLSANSFRPFCLRRSRSGAKTPSENFAPRKRGPRAVGCPRPHRCGEALGDCDGHRRFALGHVLCDRPLRDFPIAGKPRSRPRKDRTRPHTIFGSPVPISFQHRTVNPLRSRSDRRLSPHPLFRPARSMGKTAQKTKSL